MGNVGFVGLGRMGSRMAQRLANAGHTLTVWNRKDDYYHTNLASLLEEGATESHTPMECAVGRDIVFTSVADGAALQAVCLEDEGILRADPPPKILVDMSTIGPWESEGIATAADAAGVGYLRAPISGSVGLAEKGALTIMASGDRSVFEAADEYLASLGTSRYFVGSGENARYLKLIVNMNIVAQMQMLAESSVLGEKVGLDRRQMFEVIEASVASSPFVKYKIPGLLQRNYEPMASLNLAHKDTVLALGAAKRASVPAPVTELLVDIQRNAVTDGHGERDMAAVALWYETGAGLVV